MIKENIFDGKRLFTTTAPTDYSIKQVGTQEFARSTERFLNESFRGAIELTVEQNAFGYVEISVRGFAYLVKLVLSKIYGKRVLRASLTFNRSNVVFSIDFGESAEECDLTDTIYAAQRCGLASERVANKLIFCASVKPNTVISLYARDEIYSLALYNEVFFI